MSSAHKIPSVYDDPYLFACGGNEGFALLTYAPKEHSVQKISSHRPHGDQRINTLSWNHNNKVLLSGSEDQTVSMTIADGLKSLGNLRDFSSVKSICISQGSKFLVTGCVDHIVRVWDLKKSCVIREFKDHVDMITSVTFNSDDRFLATASRSGFVIIYNMETNQLSARIDLRDSQGIQSLSYSILKPGLLAISGDDGSVHVYDTLRSKMVSTFREHRAPCVSVQWTTLNQVLLVSAGLDKRIVIYDIEENKQVKEFKSPFPICSFAIHDDGSTIAAGTTLGTVLVYSMTKNQKPIEVSVLPSSPIAAIAFKKPKKSSRRSASATTAPASVTSLPSQSSSSASALKTQPLYPTSAQLPSTGATSSKLMMGQQHDANRMAVTTAATPTALGRTGPMGDKPKEMEIFSPLASSSPIDDRPVIRDLFGGAVSKSASSSTSGISSIPSVVSSVNSGFVSIHHLPNIPSTNTTNVTIAPTTARSDDMEIDEEEPKNQRRASSGGSINDDSANFAASMKSKLLNSVQQQQQAPTSLTSSPSGSSYASTMTTATTATTVSSNPNSVISAMMNDPKTTRGGSTLSDGARPASSTFPFLSALDPGHVNSPKKHGGASSHQDFASVTRIPPQSPAPPSFSDAPQTFQTQFMKSAIEDVMSTYQAAIHESIRNLHLDMLRQFHIQSEQSNHMIANLSDQVRELRQQVDKLQYENKRLKYLHSPE